LKKNLKLKVAIGATRHWLRSWRRFLNVQKPEIEKVGWLERYSLVRSTDSVALQRGLNDWGDALQRSEERDGGGGWGKISPNCFLLFCFFPFILFKVSGEMRNKLVGIYLSFSDTATPQRNVVILGVIIIFYSVWFL
jgi:hypothetical protein